jgi:hypothetical protein
MNTLTVKNLDVEVVNEMDLTGWKFYAEKEHGFDSCVYEEAYGVKLTKRAISWLEQRIKLLMKDQFLLISHSI